MVKVTFEPIEELAMRKFHTYRPEGPVTTREDPASSSEGERRERERRGDER